jgi:hypothetical protein
VAKALVVAGTVAVTTGAAILAAFVTTALILSTADIPVSLTAPGVLRALLGGAVYLAGISVLGVGFGWLLRSTAGALAVLFVVLYVTPIVGFILPAEVSAAVVPLLPGNAGNAMMQLAPSGLLSPGAGFWCSPATRSRRRPPRSWCSVGETPDEAAGPRSPGR